MFTEQTYGYQGGRGGGGGGTDWETGTDIYTLWSLRHKTNKALLDSTENPTQESVMTYMGRESKKNSRYLCITDSLCWAAGT